MVRSGALVTRAARGSTTGIKQWPGHSDDFFFSLSIGEQIETKSHCSIYILLRGYKLLYYQ